MKKTALKTIATPATAQNRRSGERKEESMNPLTQLKTTPPLLITLTLLCFALLPKAEAVNPPPDGGYPGGNTAEGSSALLSLTNGTFNTAVGFLSLKSNTEGNFNTALGAGTLLVNTAEENTATGAGALLSNTTGSQNTAHGAFALFSNTIGQFNTAIGERALLNNTTGNFNIGLGPEAGGAVITANNVIAIGGGVDGVSTTNGELSNSCYIGNIYGAGVDAGTALVVFVDQDGKLGTQALPGTGTLPTAQALSGKVQELETTVAQQAKTIAQQTKAIEAFTAGLQKVSARLEVSKPAPQTVLNDH
jgi:hypothetical protein